MDSRFHLDSSHGQFVCFCEECGINITSDRLCEHFQTEDDAALTLEVDEGINASTLEEILISLVQDKPLLWDNRLPLKERSKTKKDNAWQRISQALEYQYDIALLHKKWKNLRDSYLRAKMEMETYVPSGSAGKKPKKVWKHYHLMNFLSESVTPRSTVSNMRTPQEACGSSEESLLSPEPSSSRQKAKTREPSSVEGAIMEAIKCVPRSEPVKINNICLQLSAILDQLPSRKRAELEIDFLTRAYSALHEDNSL